MANSQRKCKQCGEYKPAGDGVKSPAGWFCCHAHAVDFAIAKSQAAAKRKASASRKAQDADRKMEKAANRKRKMDVKPISYWMKRAQAAFNAWIRARDAGKPCISCGHPDDGSRQRHASHFRSVGACSSLRFDERNVHASCSICNNWLSGNIGSYKVELIKRIGAEQVEAIESAPKLKKWKKEELLSIEAEYKARLRNSAR